MCNSGAERESVEDCESVHGWLVCVHEAGETVLRVARGWCKKLLMMVFVWLDVMKLSSALLPSYILMNDIAHTTTYTSILR